MLIIKELRKERKMTVRELAQKMGVTHPTISNWENGICEPDLKSIAKLADIFGVTLDRLFNRTMRKEGIIEIDRADLETIHLICAKYVK